MLLTCSLVLSAVLIQQFDIGLVLKFSNYFPEVVDIVDQTEDHQEEHKAEDAEGDDDDQFKMIVKVSSMFTPGVSLCLLESLNRIVLVLCYAGAG